MAEIHWKQIDEWVRQGGISATSSVALLELRARAEVARQQGDQP